MGEAKIQIKVGAIEFSGEGDEKWVATQLDKILAKATDLIQLAPTKASDVGSGSKGDESGANLGTEVPLGAFLKIMKVGSNQVRRFLATAIWLSGRGNKTLTTRDITNALSENHQSKLTNPSNCLNQNVTKGYCEKQGRQFFVTSDGLESMKP